MELEETEEAEATEAIEATRATVTWRRVTSAFAWASRMALASDGPGTPLCTSTTSAGRRGVLQRQHADPQNCYRRRLPSTSFTNATV